MYNMRTITRKTNVRQHKRNTKNKEANVKQHLRKVVRPIAGVFALKDLNWKQSKKVFPLMNPNGDWDGDGVKNKKDCRPFDVERQHDEAQDLIDSAEDEEEKINPLDKFEPKGKWHFENGGEIVTEEEPEDDGGLFVTPQEELSKSSWDILTRRRRR